MVMLLDMSKIPLPAAVEELSFDAVFDDCRTRYAQVMGIDVGDLVDSDPAVALLNVVAYLAILKRAEINDSVRNSRLPSATGPSLDDFGADPVYGLERLVLDPGDPGAVPPVPPVYESHEAYRARLQAAPASLSVAGPEGAYRVLALSAHADAVDVAVTSPNPCEILVEVLHDSADPNILTTIDAALQPDEVRPLGDRVTVQAAANETSSVNLNVYVPAGPDLYSVEVAAQQRADSILLPIAAQVRSGLVFSGMGEWIGAAHVDGVVRVEQTFQTGMSDPNTAWWPFTVNVTAVRI